ncbi:hypothetical protein [Thalassolituus oleivorans]|uniref:hypothetical protein n=1 Tax=Thalassolituus oleivorans TaxID=187493 RepID=UPI0023F0107E|nr:hypothetical protein [Thalassolituus oleivorans]
MSKLLQMALVAHDAGAANHIIYWLLAGDIDLANARISFHGPALTAATNAGLVFDNVTVEQALAGADFLVAGTGWASNIEKEAMRDAKLASISVAAVFDHWTNYDKRLYLQDTLIAVNEIWVTDVYAVELAQSFYPNSTVCLKNNRYLDYQVANVGTQAGDSNRVLFLMEPIRTLWPGETEAGEFLAFNYFLENLSQLNLTGCVDISIRPHPSDPVGKYSALERCDEVLRVSVSGDLPLHQDIAAASWVVGLQSYAMVVALEAGKKVMSVLPNNAPPCVLPHKGIMHISS